MLPASPVSTSTSKKKPSTWTSYRSYPECRSENDPIHTPMKWVHIRKWRLAKLTNWPHIYPSAAANTCRSVKEIHWLLRVTTLWFTYIGGKTEASDVSKDCHKEDHPDFVFTQSREFVQNGSGYCFHQCELKKFMRLRFVRILVLKMMFNNNR